MTKQELLEELDNITRQIFDLRDSIPENLAQYERLFGEIIITHEDVRKSIDQNLL
jgi:hypothetical protein